MREQPDWIDLWGALAWMRQEASLFQSSIFNHEEALKNAIVSGMVPTRGKALHHSEYQRIEKYIGTETTIEIFLNMVRTASTEYESAQVDRLSLESWLYANAIDQSETDSGLFDRQQTPTAVAETKIKRWLSQQPDQPTGRKADIFDWARSGHLVGEEGRALALKGFHRAWAEAAPRAWKRPGKRPKFLQLSEIKSPR